MTKRARREALWAYLMIAPLLLGFGVFFYLALAASFGISLTRWDLLSAPQWLAFGNYRQLFYDAKFLQSLWNTMRYTLLSVPASLVVSLLLALALNTGLRFQKLYRTIFFLPVLTMPVAIAVVWAWLYNPDFGLLSQLTALLGAPRIRWLSDPRWAMPSLALMSVWQGAGYGMVIFLAGLQNVPQQLYEAAHMDGATTAERFRFVTLPLLSPTIFFVLVTSLISAFQVFDIIYTMTGGGPLNTTQTVVPSIYEAGFRRFEMGYASAMAWVLFIIILLVTVVQFLLQRRWVYYD